MQIIDRNGKTQIKLLQFEAKLLRNAQHLLNRAGRNMTSQEDAMVLMRAVEAIRLLLQRGTTEEQRKKLDEQEEKDMQEAEVAIGETGNDVLVDAKTGKLLADLAPTKAV